MPLRKALSEILSSDTGALSPRMVGLIADLAQDWRRLDERIAAVSAEIEALAEQDHSCQRLMTVPGSGRSSRAPWWPRSALETCSRKAATSAPGLDWCRSRYRPATARSSARYQGAAIATCARCSCKPRGLCWSG